MNEISRETYDSRLMMCRSVSISVDATIHTAKLYLDKSSNPDMAGCLAYFLDFDPDVRLITVYRGSKEEIRYEKRESAWVAVDGGVSFDDDAIPLKGLWDLLARVRRERAAGDSPDEVS